MPELRVEQVRRYDSLYVSPRKGDAFLSCAARLHADASKGRAALLLTLFEGPSFREAGPLPDLAGVDHVSLGFEPASRRHPKRAALSSLRFEAFPEDDPLRRDRLARLLVELRPRVAPRDVFAPLGVGGHLDHRIAHDACVAAFGGREAGRNVFLYEERPESFGRGQVRLRLGLLGARLPAGAVRAADRSSFLRHLARHHRGAQLRGEGGGVFDRLKAFRPAAAQWREAGAWNPQKAFGPRLQPVVHVADASALAFAQQVTAAVVPACRRRRARYQALAAAYAQRLQGGAPYVERYWLLLPLLEGGREPAIDAVEDPLI